MASPTLLTRPRSRYPVRGVIHDGLSARAQPVEIRFDGDGVHLDGGDGSTEFVPRTVLRRGDRAAPRPALHRTDQPDWRLVPDAAPPPDWLRGLPDIGSLSPRARRWYAATAAIALAILGGLWAFGDTLLDITAPLVPQRMLAQVGDGLVRQPGGEQCVDAAGTAALGRLTARLTPTHGFVEPVRVTVLDTAAVNALAAPGGWVVLFRGVLDKATGPDEVAGVLAHEFTHVALRHPTKSLLRQMGVSLLVRAIGGDVGGYADLAVVLSSSRRAEAAADTGAVAQLRASHISPAGLAAFFHRILSEDRAKPKDATERVLDQIGSYAATHPGESERAVMVEAAFMRQGAVTPALNAADWRALRQICAVKAQS